MENEKQTIDEIIKIETENMVNKVKSRFEETGHPFNEYDESILRIGITCGLGVAGLTLSDFSNIGIEFKENNEENKNEDNN